MVTPLVLVLAVGGAAYGYVADRIGARWPEHEDGSVRARDWRTVAVVLVAAAAFGLLTIRFEGPVEQVAFGLYLAALVLGLATDLDQRLLPNVITYPLVPLALVFALSGANPLVPPGLVPIAAVAAVLIPGLLFLFSIPFGAGAFGLGDVKLLISVGLMTGPLRLFSGVVAGALLAGVVIVVLLALRRITLRDFIPYGPFLVLGAFWTILVSS